MYIKQLYSGYACIAFSENLHVSVVAQLTFNNIEVYKTLCIRVKSCKKRNMFKTEIIYRKLPVFLSNISFSLKFRMQIAFQINILPFSIAFIGRLTEMD